MEEFITPIIKVTKVGKGKGKDNQLAFYSLPEYEKWKKENGVGTEGSESKWRIKYYKGLGTNTTEEGKSYFAKLDSHKISFVWGGDTDGKLIEMAFKKDQAEARKDWLSTYAAANQAEIFVDHSQKQLSISDFINKVILELQVCAFTHSFQGIGSVLQCGQHPQHPFGHRRTQTRPTQGIVNRC